MTRYTAKHTVHHVAAATALPHENNPRERVLRSAVLVIAEHGYTSGTVSEIAQRADVARTAFYRLFRNKDDVLSTALTETSRQIMYEMQVAQASAREWPDKVCASLRAMLDFFTNDPELARVAFVEAQVAGPWAVSQVQDAMRQYAAELARPLSSEDHRSNALPATASEQIVGAIYFTIYDAVAHGDTRNLLKLLPDIVEITLSPYMQPQAVQAIIDKHYIDDS